MPKAYALFQNNLQEGEKFGRYVGAAIGTIIPHGGQVLVAAEAYDSREGSIPTRRTAILEFPSREAAVGWYESPEYQAIVHLRHESTSEGSCQILDGFVLPSA
ncbi:MAG: DUF1330 domain-containing protein [Tepidiformaceae bacterium]